MRGLLHEFRASLPDIIEGRDPLDGMTLDECQRWLRLFGTRTRRNLVTTKHCGEPVAAEYQSQRFVAVNGAGAAGVKIIRHANTPLSESDGS